MIIDLDVFGTPMPQGSKKAFVANGRAMMKESGGNKHAQWRNAVADKAFDAAKEHGRLEGALAVTVSFRFPMPKSRPKAVRDEGWAWKTVAPDIDKLLRTVFDGLQAGGLLADDAHVAQVTSTKAEVTGATGAHITIASLD